jgi:hypothetical protein
MSNTLDLHFPRVSFRILCGRGWEDNSVFILQISAVSQVLAVLVEKWVQTGHFYCARKLSLAPPSPPPAWQTDWFNRQLRPTLHREIGPRGRRGPSGLICLRGRSWYPLPSWLGRLAWTSEALLAVSLVASVVPRGPCAQNCA